MSVSRCPATGRPSPRPLIRHPVKKLVADLSLDKAMLQEVIEKNFEGRSEALSHRLHARQLSGERTASLLCPAFDSIELQTHVDS